MGELKSSGDITNSLLKALNAENGLDLKALTARLSSSEQEALETNLIRGVIEKFTKDGITDFSKVSNTLKNAPFESKRAVEIMGELNKKAPILNNTSSLLEKLTAINPKAKELQQGIGHSVTGALMTMKRNLAVERLKSLLPVLGNDASLKNHIRNAINNAGDLKSVINNLEKIEIKDAPENSTKLLEAFKNEVKALREEAQTAEIKGDNFITKESPAPKSDLNVKISVDDWVRELGGINANKQIKADLAKLYEKHKELFTKPSDVYRLLKEIKNNPTHFFKNNRPDIALIAKVLEDGSVGKLGIVKESGLVGHLSKSTNKNEMDRLRKVNEKELKVGTPYPTLQRADVNQVGPTAGAKSTFSSSDESIIPKQTQEEFKKLLNEYDVDKFLSDRENILAKNAKYGRNRIADRNIESNDGVGGWEYKLTPAGYEKNYKADFLTTKADVAKIRAGKMDEATFNKLKSDLESSDALGYEYKKASDYADMEDFEREFGSLSNPKGSRTINASPHIASGLLGGTANGADENGNVSPEEFAKGFIYALFGSKITAEGVKRVSPELYNKILSISKKPSEEIKNIVDNAGVDKLAKQEKRGIYNVTYNGKKATWLKQDMANIDNAIRYESGNLSKGAKHISIRHLDDESKEGFVTKEELLNLGKNVRKFIKEHKEPFINDRKARLYEWEDDKGVRFRLVVGNETAGTPYTDELPRPAVSNDIITFYSDRNLKEPMKFENPKLKLLDAIDTSGDKVGLVKKVLLNKDISDGVKAKAVNRLTKNKISQGAKIVIFSL
ncbi:hypothetical protein [Campylobacter concisus]|uniref:hypothetical protein n=1 Tax=Campylobacter concisus TaxID=199 RepID=UPI000CD81005|nr:hypothetical protein [Campylobacter concisus]